jgi:CheY-like chemotaxis protein
MPISVLIFESDPSFAHELESGLQRAGCETTVADDANVGLQIAATRKPDLILLTIELPRMNGFSVCNKLKRDPNLQDVPLIILSSDSTEETFEQHRRLRTRAEEYLHKPVTVDHLLPVMRRLVPGFAAVASRAPSAAPEPLADDDLLIDEAEIMSARPVPDRQVDGDVDSFTEQAFDALIERPAPSARPPSLPVRNARESAAPEVASVPRPSEIPVSADTERMRRQNEELQEELRKARATISEMEDGAHLQASRDAEVARLRRELDELKARGPSSRTGGTAREFLDLREQLNRKDKEILEIRDELNRREREIINLRENSLVVERERADLTDRVEELERKLGEAERLGEVLRGDKEQASKRADDFKRKAEKLRSELDDRTMEYDVAQKKHASELQERDAQQAALRAEHAEALQATEQRVREETIAQAENEKQEALAEAEARAEAARQEALRAQAADMQRQFQEKLGGVNRAHEETVNKLHAEHEQLVEEIAQERETTRVALAERDGRIGSLESALSGCMRERDSARATLSEREARIDSLQAELGETRQQRDEAQGAYAAEQYQLEKARAKWAEDRLALEMAKQNVTSALARLEEIERRPLE